MKGRPSRPRQQQQQQSEGLTGSECEMNVTLKSKAGKINEREGDGNHLHQGVRETQREQRMDGWMEGGRSNY